MTAIFSFGLIRDFLSACAAIVRFVSHQEFIREQAIAKLQNGKHVQRLYDCSLMNGCLWYTCCALLLAWWTKVSPAIGRSLALR